MEAETSQGLQLDKLEVARIHLHRETQTSTLWQLLRCEGLLVIAANIILIHGAKSD